METREFAMLENNKRDLIDRDLLHCYRQIVKNEAVGPIIRSHKKLINQVQLVGHNKKVDLKGHNKNHQSLATLIHYKNTKDHSIALSVLTNTLNNKGLFSKFVS